MDVEPQKNYFPAKLLAIFFKLLVKTLTIFVICYN